LGSPRGLKNSEKTKSGLADLQVFEIAQNRQSILCKGFRKKRKGLQKKGEIL
jgi:hypothetical protein